MKLFSRNAGKGSRINKSKMDGKAVEILYAKHRTLHNRITELELILSAVRRDVARIDRRAYERNTTKPTPKNIPAIINTLGKPGDNGNREEEKKHFSELFGI